MQVELKNKTKELGEEEQKRRVRERMRIFQEQTLKDAEETREKDRRETQRKLEKMEGMELEEDEDIAVIEDNDFVIKGPSAEEWEKMETEGWGGPARKFVDVRIKDAQREFNASGAVRKVVLSSERVKGAEGGKEDRLEVEENERCTSYEEDESEDEKEVAEKEQREKEQKEKEGAEKEQREKEEEQNKGDKEQKEGEKEPGKGVTANEEEEDDAKWGEIWEDMYGGDEFTIEEDADTVARFANAGGYNIESESQNVKMVACLIRKLRNFREGREREEEQEGESKKGEETKKVEEGESRRERKREKESDRKNRSRSRRDLSVGNRSKRPPSRQVRKSHSPMEDE